MSRRRFLPDSLRRAGTVGRMEMGLSEADPSRNLNVSLSVCKRLWNQYQSEDFISRKHIPSQTQSTKPAEDRFQYISAQRRKTTTVSQIFAVHFVV
ncbi:HTH_Tnp_Tc3_2 domain-containing protein [Trichonephila clavipes]|nr:HTH_Tnp_Tc3_2 domain-containing protein [Trichonephila clavipes]